MKFLFVFFLISCSAITNTFASVENTTAYSIDKKKIELINFKSFEKDTVVIFLSKDCPCSRLNLDYINQLSSEYKNFNFIGIHSRKETTPELVSEFLTKKKLDFPLYNDPELKIANLFGALKTPHAFIVNKTGDLIYNGGITNTVNPNSAKEFFLRDALTDITNHKAPTKSQTKTLGCFIIR